MSDLSSGDLSNGGRSGVTGRALQTFDRRAAEERDTKVADEAG